MIMHASSPSRRLAGWFSAASLTLMASTASAAVLYEQPPVDGGNGYYANVNFGQQAADDFNLGGAANLVSVAWWGSYDGNNDAGDDDFLVRLYSSMTDTGTLLQEYNPIGHTRASTSLTDLAQNVIYRYDFTLPVAISLGVGTYYFAVQNLGSSDWIWVEGGNGNNQYWSRYDDQYSWALAADANAQPEAWDLAFELNGTRVVQVPEPSSFALLGIAGLSMLLARRRQRQAA